MKLLFLILLFACDSVRYPQGAYDAREKAINERRGEITRCYKAPVANGAALKFTVDLSENEPEAVGYITHPVNIEESELYDRNCIHTALQKVKFPVLGALTKEKMRFEFDHDHWKFVPKKK
jgi:hypothetical protein